MLLTILNIVFPVFAVIGVGTVWGKLHRPDLALVNRLNMELFVPALVFAVMAGKDFQIAAYQQLAEVIDIGALRAALDDWPATTPANPVLADRLRFHLPAVLYIGRFLDFETGRNPQ